ncbi:D-lyxose ketol-isomerase [Pararhizobium capsulatum DSM 1112]|uniref:D-lyxose ketol-isomerase n=1 Tax=Pararhizobium capsulatum DSM 1112 TaxID=1121113 RepID=A0ABU0BQY2_9HYPH|nr:D-lyxose/D-mannose family sugar isomerase [Pararhizobium capsulatum]MDQ0320653.1 D-lyxose ketol-isomerase [Pararhizobium capsulatum DSM 1112]
MLRSEVNAIIDKSDAFMRSFGFVLPPFAYWGPEELKQRAATDSPSIRDARLGWDITDFGKGRFGSYGLVLFTLRNGTSGALSSGHGMIYAEKLMITAKDQTNPLHRHAVKTEDIINRGGGMLVLQMYNSLADGTVDEESEVVVATDARLRRFSPGGLLKLAPGESVTLLPGNWHAFWAEGADVLIGEVSTVNDDLTDNYFREPVGRFSTIQEDTAPNHLLVSDYDTWVR